MRRVVLVFLCLVLALPCVGGAQETGKELRYKLSRPSKYRKAKKTPQPDPALSIKTTEPAKAPETMAPKAVQAPARPEAPTVAAPAAPSAPAPLAPSQQMAPRPAPVAAPEPAPAPAPVQGAPKAAQAPAQQQAPVPANTVQAPAAPIEKAPQLQPESQAAERVEPVDDEVVQKEIVAEPEPVAVEPSSPVEDEVATGEPDVVPPVVEEPAAIAEEPVKEEAPVVASPETPEPEADVAAIEPLVPVAPVAPLAKPDPPRPPRYSDEMVSHFLGVTLYDKDAQLAHSRGGKAPKDRVLTRWEGPMLLRVVGADAALLAEIERAVADVGRVLPGPVTSIEFATNGEANAQIYVLDGDGGGIDGYTRSTYDEGQVIVGSHIVLYRESATAGVIRRELLHALGFTGCDTLGRQSLMHQGDAPVQAQDGGVPEVDRVALKLLYHPAFEAGMDLDEARRVVDSLQ